MVKLSFRASQLRRPLTFTKYTLHTAVEPR